MHEVFLANLAAGPSPPQEEAAEHVKKYEWREAAECYEKLSGLSLRGSRESVELAFLSAGCRINASSRTRTAEDFRGEVEVARTTYLRVEEEFGEDPSSLTYRIAKARRIQAECMLVPAAEQRRRLLDEAISIHRSVVADSFQEGRIPLSLGNFHLSLLLSRRAIDDGGSIPVLLNEMLVLGERLASYSPDEVDVDELSEAYTLFLLALFFASRFFEEFARNPAPRIEIVEKAEKLLPRIMSVYARGRLNHAIAANEFFLEMREQGSEHLAASLADARASGVKAAIYMPLGLYAGTIALFNLLAERDEEQARLRFREILSSLEGSKRDISHMSDPRSIHTRVYLYRAAVQGHYEYAKHFVTDLKLRRQLAEKGLELFREGWPLAELTEIDSGIWLAQMGPEALRYLASFEPAGIRRQELLVEAISIGEKAKIAIARREPFATPWWTGELIIQQGLIRYDLAREIEDETKKQQMLRIAVDRLREGLEKARSGLNEFVSSIPSFFGGTQTSLGGYLLGFSKALGDLHQLTNDPRLVQEQLAALDKAADSYSKAERPARVAEVFWQKAQILSVGGNHREASSEFKHSSQLYEKAAVGNASLERLYSDLARYMIGWSEIEEARAAHAVGLYMDASRAYDGAVTTFRGTQRWSPLSDLYLACSILEKAEAASYEEDSESALRLFAQAADSFSASQVASNSWDPEPLGEGGKEEVLGWEKVAIGRERYCRARAEVEDAKLLYGKGDHSPSARRFAVARTILEGLAEGAEKEGKRELTTLALLCSAWQALEEAEATSSSQRYADAAQIFGRAADSAGSKKVGFLARGHAAYCNALKLGVELRSRRDPDVYRQTKDSLEDAIDSYTNAMAPRGALWARGTERLLDGLIYSGRAESELDVKAKADLYALSERSLESAAKLYEEAKFTIKKIQAEKHLQVVREHRKIFASPAEAIDASFVVSSPQAQVAPRLTRDQPVGIERFGTAYVQGTLTANRTEIVVGEVVEMLLQLVSAGRSPAILVKLTEIEAPGLEAEIVGEKYRVEEGGEVNFKGRRVEPFETLDIRVKLSPKRTGDFTFSPSVLYLDEGGQYRRYQANSSTFKVVPSAKGEGIPAAEPPEAIQFKNTAAKAVFDSLVSAFIEDYMVKKLYLEQAGWRSLTKLSEASGIAHASLYGTHGHYGPSLNELLSRGLIETRVFTGQRGRGGEVIKVRISYGKEPIKRHIDTHIMKPKKD